MRQHLHVLALAITLAATLASRLLADGPNLVANGGFDLGILGWDSSVPGITWEPPDLAGDPRSGSLLLEATGTTFHGTISSCFPVVPGQRYAFGGSSWVDPSGFLPGDEILLRYSFYSDATCFASVGDFDDLPSTQQGRWERRARLVTAPVNAASARLIALIIPRHGPSDPTLRAYFDDLYFRTASCAPDATSLCLANGRFRVTTRWRTGAGHVGDGRPVPFSKNAGSFWFFAADNLELDVKVIDACSLNHRFWFFAAGLTDVQVTLTVTDTQTGQQKVYTNPLGRTFTTITDTNAFATCP